MNLQSARERVKLAPRGRPYTVRIIPGLHLGYRAGTGAWIAIGSDGKGGQWHEGIGTADNNGVKADGVTVLTYAQAVDVARKIANGRKGVDISKPKTIDEALNAYALDLEDRGKDPYNAKTPRVHLTAPLLAQSLDIVEASTLKKWRDGLRHDGMTAATLNRVLKPLLAACNLAAKFDPRIAANAAAWKVGLEMAPNATRARDAVLSDNDVRAIVAQAYAVDPAFGLFVQVHAEVGARSSQIVRLTVGDVQPDRLMVPSSNKGGSKVKADRPAIPVRITPALAAALAAAAAGRPSNEPLLRKADGTPWQEQDHRYPFARAAKSANLPDATIYALRHSSIVRQLLAKRPIIVVAKVHDTSVVEIENHYGRWIANYFDDAPLLDTTPGANVVSIKSA